MELTIGPLKAGFEQGTGDPEDDNGERPAEGEGSNRTYVERNGSSLNSHRLGLGYMGLGSLKVGIDSEKGVRTPIHNNFHKAIGSAQFENMNTETKPYIEISND